MSDMKIWVLANQKGGACKTTTAVNVAARLGEMNYRVLVVDMDGQGNCSEYLGHNIKMMKKPPVGLAMGLMSGDLSTAVIDKTSAENVSLIASSGNNLRVLDVGQQEERAFLILGEALRELDNQYDFCIIDTPPNLGFLTMSALAAADEVIVPIDGTFALGGAAELQGTMRKLAKLMGRKPPKPIFVPSKWKATQNLAKSMDKSLGKFTDRVTRGVRRCVRIEESPSHGLPVRQYAKSIKQRNPASVGDFKRVTEQLLEMTA